MAKETVWVRVPVEVPEKIELDVAGYVSKFISIGLADLQVSLEDSEMEFSDDDKIVAEHCAFGVAIIERNF
jgi:hypothetical protein